MRPPGKLDAGLNQQEVRRLSANRSTAFLYLSTYLNFGWSLDSCETKAHQSIQLSFHRPRASCTHGNLIRLQREFDAAIGEIEALEHHQGRKAAAVSVAVDLAGLALMILAFGLHFTQILLPGIVCFLVGIGLCIGSYFVYAYVLRRVAVAYTTVFVERYQTIYHLGTQAYDLLHPKHRKEDPHV